MRGLLLRLQGPVHRLILCVLHGLTVHLVEVHGVGMMMKTIVHENASLS